MAQRERVAEVRNYSLIEELLTAQGWELRKPPYGDVLAQQEYKDYPSLREALKASGKTGKGGAGVPEYVLVSRDGGDPLAVFEGKAHVKDLPAAISDVKKYGGAFREAGLSPVLVAVAGTESDRFELRVFKWAGSRWKEITYEGRPISWIPNREQMARILDSEALFELRPEVPSVEVLKEKAEEINTLLRESGLKDDFRPAAIGAIMLALWKSRGEIRRDKRYILADINQSCEQAFWDAKKTELAKSLRVDEANHKLAVRAARICQILERLNITTLTAEHDYLGALYEEFFRYTGGNTIGQYFTPRHITTLMADLANIQRDSVVLDPACGTGGFLIAAMERIQRESRLPREEVVKVVKRQLIGLEDEPVTAALCVANMILRGDGTSGVVKADCFTYPKYPTGKADVVLMNPPFPHKKTDTPPEKFIDRALEGLVSKGRAAIIVPSSLLVKSTKKEWRENLLKKNTLLAVISLPSELFQPYASATTAILLIEKGVAHRADKPIFFCRVENDGYRIKKGVRVLVPGSQLPALVKEFHRLGSIPEFCGPAFYDSESGFAPGAYIGARALNDDELKREIGAIVRNKAAFMVRRAPEIATMMAAVKSDEFSPERYKPRQRQKRTHRASLGKIGDYFDIFYGQKELHSKENLTPGKALVISSSGIDNGCYGFFDFNRLIEPPFVSVPSTGSIGEASVQELPCGVVDDCLLLFAKEGVPVEALYAAAATLRHEKWRFDYGRKMTPARIAGFPLNLGDDLLNWVRSERTKALALERTALLAFSEREANRDDTDGKSPKRKSVSVESATLSLLSEVDAVRHLASIRAGGRKYRISPPVPYVVRNEGEHVFAEAEEFHLYADGASVDAASEELQRHFAALVEGYALEDDSQLAKSGRDLKQRLLARLKRV